MGEADPLGHLEEAFQLTLLRALVSGLDGYVSCHDRERRILFLNRTRTRDLTQILGKRMEDFITPPHREASIECMERAFASGQPQQIEFTVNLAQAGQVHLVSKMVPFRSPSGAEVALLITSDVSEPRRLALELEQSIEFRRRVVEHLPDLVALLDRESRAVWVNRALPEPQQAAPIGALLQSLIAPAGLRRIEAGIAAAFATSVSEQFEAEGYRDAQPAWYSVRVVPVPTEGKLEDVLLIATDITERKRAEQALRETEEQLQRAQRLESLGQLAGGIAHDFNNLLQVLEGNLAFAKQGLQAGELPIDELEQAMRATERAAELTSHLLAIGRRKRVDTRRVDLGALVGHSIRMLRRAIPASVALEYEPPPMPFFVALDAPQFEQVLINLCVNARDAMPDGGTLRVRIEADGEAHVLLTVHDTGTGIAPEHLSRVFEPFFTTKGAGSGLGLAVAAGIVAAHGGVMLAESDGRAGTSMKVRLPRVGAGSELPPAELDGGSSGSGLILIAEDEDLVRAQLERILRNAGYRVLEARTGRRAVELFREHQGEIALVILDVVMPELDGWRAFLAMEALVPQLKVLFTTGYAANVLPQDFAVRGARLLSKPYKPQRLLAQVREMLQTSTRPAVSPALADPEDH